MIGAGDGPGTTSFSPKAFVQSRNSIAFAIALSVATAFLIGISYFATLQARRSAGLLLERRVAERLALLSLGIIQDMRGAHATVLVPVTPNLLVLDPPHDLAEVFARGFARFPYPEFFFTWNASGGEDGVAYMFTRTDRPPNWHHPDRSAGLYPVDVARDPPVLGNLVHRVRKEAQDQRPGAMLDVTFAGLPYQVIANFLYESDGPGKVSGLAGMAVNLEWVRESYFDELAMQIASIGGEPDEVALEVLDENRQIVTSTLPRSPDGLFAERQFPLAFVDRALLGTFQIERRSVPLWTARVGAPSENSVAISGLMIEGTFVLASLAAIATLAGLIVTIRGVKVAAELAAMKSDFVSSVTHELKTPLAVIRLIADTLAGGRYDSPQTIRDYAGLLSREARSLGSLVDNLLAYARVSDGTHAYTFELVDVSELIEGTIERFHALLLEQQFTVNAELPSDLPAVRADRSALIQAIDNLVDNAVKYSDQVRVLEISASVVRHHICISIADRGIGIRDDELGRVSEKFFRGRDAKRGGSGLGLAIVRQIVAAHGGSLHIDSQLGSGTRVRLLLPQATPA